MPPPDHRIASIGHDVAVGGFLACDRYRRRFNAAIHIWHPYQEGKWICQCKPNPGPNDLVIEYYDGSSLSTIPGGIQAIADFVIAHPGPLLIHCAWGSYRSPTLAIIAKIARGCQPFEAVRDLLGGLWRGYRQAPHLHDVPLGEILAWAAERAGTNSVHPDNRLDTFPPFCDEPAQIG